MKAHLFNARWADLGIAAESGHSLIHPALCMMRLQSRSSWRSASMLSGTSWAIEIARIAAAMRIAGWVNFLEIVAIDDGGLHSLSS